MTSDSPQRPSLAQPIAPLQLPPQRPDTSTKSPEDAIPSQVQAAKAKRALLQHSSLPQNLAASSVSLYSSTLTLLPASRPVFRRCRSTLHTCRPCSHSTLYWPFASFCSSSKSCSQSHRRGHQVYPTYFASRRCIICRPRPTSSSSSDLSAGWSRRQGRRLRSPAHLKEERSHSHSWTDPFQTSSPSKRQSSEQQRAFSHPPHLRLAGEPSLFHTRVHALSPETLLRPRYSQTLPLSVHSPYRAPHSAIPKHPIEVRQL